MCWRRRCTGRRCSLLPHLRDRKSTRLNSSHGYISYAVFCLKKKKQISRERRRLTRERHAAVLSAADTAAVVSCEIDRTTLSADIEIELASSQKTARLQSSAT